MRHRNDDRAEPEFAAPHPDDDARAGYDERPGLRRWAAIAIAGGAVIGFGGIVAYGYLTYANRHGATPAPLVVADQRPVRVKPEHDGALEVPHKNIEVFDAGQRGQRSGLPRGAETLLPPPETPLPKPAPTPVAQPVAVGPQASTPRQAAAGDATQAAIGDVGTAAVGPAPPPPPPAPHSVASAPAQRVASVAAPPAERVASAAAPPARASGFRIQVGAMRTEAEARAAWDQAARRHPDILGRMTPTYSRVELGDRGSFFRVQAGPLPSRDAARDACETLKKAGTVCFVVPPT